MKKIRINKSIEVFLVVLLIMAISISAAVLMNAGRNTYKRILDNGNSLENARIALSYLNMRIRQNDTRGAIEFSESWIEGNDALLIKHSGLEEGMITYIYYSDGALREIYTWVDNVPEPDNNEVIVELSGMEVEYYRNEGFFRVIVEYMQNEENMSMERIISIKSD